MTTTQVTEDMPQTIRQWSISRLDTYETCPYQTKIKYIDRIPEPDRGDPPKGMAEWPNDRGTRVHDQAEKFVKGERPDLIAECAAFAEEFHELRKLCEQGKIVAEEGWAFDHDWKSVPYDDYDAIWARFIIDCLVFLSPTEAVVIDYKTGKRIGNEVKHGKQVQAYQLVAFLRYPQLEKITTELWYLDQNELSRQTFTRAQGLRFFEGLNNRAVNMTTATVFPTKASNRNCFFCPYKTGLIGKYGPEGTGDCDANLH